MVEFKSYDELEDKDEVNFLVAQLEGCVSGFWFESDYEEFTKCLRRLLELVKKEGA